MKKYISLLLFLMLSLSIFAQDKFLHELTSKIKKAAEYFPQEKVYLQLNKSFYTPGDNIWFSGHIIDGSYSIPSELSKQILLQLFDMHGSMVMNKNFVVSDGKTYGDLTLPENLEEGFYTLFAYTNWMKNLAPENIFQVRIPVIIPNLDNANVSEISSEIPPESPGKISVKLFPEGGSLVTGFENQIVLTSMDMNSTPISIEGQIIDDRDSTIAKITTNTHGLGSFIINPQLNKTYCLIVDGENILQLPKQIKNGVKLVLQSVEEEYINFKAVAGNPKLHLNTYWVVRGGDDIYWSTKVDFQGFYTLRIPTIELPQGPVEVVIFNEDAEILSNRLVFIPKNVGAVITSESENQTFAQQSEISLTINSTRLTESDDYAKASLTVVPYNPHAIEEEITTSLLLESELIPPFPGFEYSSVLADSESLDMLLIASRLDRIGWDRIIRIDETKNSFLPMETVSGKVVDENDNPVLNAKVRVVTKDLSTEERLTDANGDFTFAPLPILPDQVEQVIAEAPGNTKVKVMLNKSFEERLGDHVVDFNKSHPDLIGNLKSIKNNLGSAAANYYSQLISGENPNSSINLKESQQERIPAYKKFLTNHSVLETIFFIKPYRVINGKIVFYGTESSIYAQGGALIVVDGVKIGTDVIIVESIAPIDVKEIFVSTNPVDIMRHTALNATAVIEIATKRNPNDFWNPRTESSSRKSREFITPEYDEDETYKPDYRYTLHWEPDIQLEEDDDYEVEFYTPNRQGKYIAILEGVTKFGKVFRTEYLFEVK